MLAWLDFVLINEFFLWLTLNIPIKTDTMPTSRKKRSICTEEIELETNDHDLSTTENGTIRWNPFYIPLKHFQGLRASIKRQRPYQNTGDAGKFNLRQYAIVRSKNYRSEKRLLLFLHIKVAVTAYLRVIIHLAVYES